MTTSGDGGEVGAAAVEGTPAFSFLTTAYRAEDTLGRTIDAVLAQTRTDWELVVVDNGMDDAVVAVVEPHLTDPRVQLVRQENKGPVGGVRAAAERATGRYLVVLNADDAIAADFCARTGAVFDAEPGVAAVTCDAVQFVDPGEQPLVSSYLESAGLAEPPAGAVRLRVPDVIDGPCPYYTAPIRRDVWDALGGMGHDTENPVVHDLEFWLRLLLAGYDVRRTGAKLGRFRLERGSESRPTDPARTEEFERQRETVLRHAAEAADDPEATAALERVLRRLHYQQAIRRARVAFAAGDAAGARRHAEAAHAQRPTARTGALVLALRLAPGPLSAVHPIKRHVQARLDRLRRRDWRAGLRRSNGGRSNGAGSNGGRSPSRRTAR